MSGNSNSVQTSAKLSPMWYLQAALRHEDQDVAYLFVSALLFITAILANIPGDQTSIAEAKKQVALHERLLAANEQVLSENHRALAQAERALSDIKKKK